MRYLILLIFFIIHSITFSSFFSDATYYSGLNISNTRGFELDLDKDSKRVAITLGFLKSKMIHDNLYFQSGLFIAQRGTQNFYTENSNNIEQRWFLDYIEVPFLVAYEFPFNFDRVTFIAKHGFVLGYLFRYSQNKLTNRVVETNVPFDFDVNRQLVDIHFGFGFVKPLKQKTFSMDIIYRLGLRGIGGSDLDIKNNSIDVVFGLKFGS